MISIVIPTLRDAGQVAACVIRLGPAVLEAALKEVIFADGAGDAEIAKIAEETGARLVPGPADRGPRLAAGLSEARGAWVGLLDPAARLPETWAAAALRHIADVPDTPGWAAHPGGALARALTGPRPGFLLLPRSAAMAQVEALRSGAERGLMRGLGRRNLHRLDFTLDLAD